MTIQTSVVIPTFNRRESLLKLLDSLSCQTLDSQTFEVIVIDDGSDYNPSEITNKEYPFLLRYLRQTNQGATVARNNGAMQSQGAVLVFIDDDVTVSQETLKALVQACTSEPELVTIGMLIACNNQADSPFTKVTIEEENRKYLGQESKDLYVHFTECNTQLLGVRRNDFIQLGMLQDPTGGWPNWDDVDFGYRAHLAGFRLMRCGSAIGEHWDYSLSSLQASSQRWFRASKSAVKLFQKHPGLYSNIPMFQDKTPFNWRKDSPRLIIRKILRRWLSLRLILSISEKIASVLEKHYPSVTLLRPLYRWINGGYMFQGYREGLRVFGQDAGPAMVG